MLKSFFKILVISALAFVILNLAWPLRKSHTNFSLEENPIAKTISPLTCKTSIDASGIRHLQAKTDLEIYACFGYAHALDRGWQMDYFRRLSQGTSSEVLGSKNLRVDFLMRTLELSQEAERLFLESPSEIKNILWAYSYGTNHGFQNLIKREGVEFKRFGYEPRIWKPTDTIAIMLMQSFLQTRSGLKTDRDLEKKKEKYGDELVLLLEKAETPWKTSIFKEGEYEKETHSQLSPKERKELASLSDEFILENKWGGSNSWLVSASRSKSHKALLANDPHLPLTYPPYLHWLHLESLENSGINAMGATPPGIPQIISGLNTHIAWGITNAFLKVSSLLLVDNTELENFKTHRPVIWFKFWNIQIPFFFKTYKKPASDLRSLPLEAPKGKSVLLRWAGLDLQGSEDFSGIFDIIKSKSSQEMQTFISASGFPSWNFIFADTQNSIGLAVAGRMIDRQTDVYLGEETVNLKSLTPLKFLPAEKKPHLLNPHRGYIATANNFFFPSDSLYKTGNSFEPSFRAFRIEELLQKKETHDFESFSEIQCDTQAVDARFILPTILESMSKDVEDFSQIEKRAYFHLMKWDHQMVLNCEACSLYQRLIEELKASTDLTETDLYFILKEKKSDEVKQKTLKIFKQTVAELKRKDSFIPWQEIQNTPLPHISEDPKFNFKDKFYALGNRHSVWMNEGDWKDSKNYIQEYGPTHRLIVEMTNPPKASIAISGPQVFAAERKLSDPRSSFSKWQNCKYDNLSFPYDWAHSAYEEIQIP